MTIPWIKARATSAPAGLLARGSLRDARLPRSLDPVAGPRMTEGRVRRAIRSQLQGQPRIWMEAIRTAFPN